MAEEKLTSLVIMLLKQIADHNGEVFEEILRLVNARSKKRIEKIVKQIHDHINSQHDL